MFRPSFEIISSKSFCINFFLNSIITKYLLKQFILIFFYSQSKLITCFFFLFHGKKTANSNIYIQIKHANWTSGTIFLYFFQAKICFTIIFKFLQGIQFSIQFSHSFESENHQTKYEREKRRKKVKLIFFFVFWTMHEKFRSFFTFNLNRSWFFLIFHQQYKFTVEFNH